MRIGLGKQVSEEYLISSSCFSMIPIELHFLPPSSSSYFIKYWQTNWYWNFVTEFCNKQLRYRIRLLGRSAFIPFYGSTELKIRLRWLPLRPIRYDWRLLSITSLPFTQGKIRDWFTPFYWYNYELNTTISFFPLQKCFVLHWLHLLC